MCCNYKELVQRLLHSVSSSLHELVRRLRVDTHASTDDPTSINAILFQGTTCVPSVVNPFATQCTLGSYPPLSVNVSTVAQVQLAVNLARNLDIRLVIKNTGHDFGAKSTGAGSCE